MLTTFLLLCRSAWNPKLTRGYEGHHGLAVAQGRDVLIKDWQVGGADQGGYEGHHSLFPDAGGRGNASR